MALGLLEHRDERRLPVITVNDVPRGRFACQFKSALTEKHESLRIISVISPSASIEAVPHKIGVRADQINRHAIFNRGFQDDPSRAAPSYRDFNFHTGFFHRGKLL